MSIDEIIQSMRARMPWSVGQLVLRRHGIRPGLGWAKTHQKLSDHPADFFQEAGTLAASLKEHLLCGEKLVRFYEIEEKAKTEMIDAVRKLKIPPSAFSQSYPILLSEDELAEQSSIPTLVAIEEDDDAITTVFASRRVLVIREPLIKDDLPEEVAEALSDYDEIVGMKHVYHQAMDIVSIPLKNNKVNIRIDYPHGMHRDVGRVAQDKIKQTMSDLIKADNYSSPINLFPLISEMYHVQSEGNVVDLAFGTVTASLKHERMRRRGLCLRNETYHEAGKAALKEPIQPYRLSIVWQIENQDIGSSAPELGLHSSSLVAGGTEPILLDAVFRKCVGKSDFEHVRSRIEFFLSGNHNSYGQ